jgi:CBS-domain-containing membrane protein
MKNKLKFVKLSIIEIVMSKIILIDKKFRKNSLKYIFQCFLAAITILAVLIFLDVLKETAIITSLGASAFIVFTMPTQYSSDPRRLIGGYIVGLIVGFVFYIISQLQIKNIFALSETTVLIIFGAIAVGFAIFIMAVTNTEHAPAAGISLGLVINQWDYLTIIFIVLAIIWLASVRLILKKYLMDLISPHLNPPQEHKR